MGHEGHGADGRPRPCKPLHFQEGGTVVLPEGKREREQGREWGLGHTKEPHWLQGREPGRNWGVWVTQASCLSDKEAGEARPQMGSTWRRRGPQGKIQSHSHTFCRPHGES